MKRLLPLVLLAACTGPAEAPRMSQSPAPPPPPADSLVLTLPDSTTIWLLPGRKGVAADGSTCDEWSIQTRNGAGRHLAPLLYTRHAPRLIRGKVLAIQSNRCVDGDLYLIEPATGYPFKQPGAR
jgi:hypothetical protein